MLVTCARQNRVSGEGDGDVGGDVRGAPLAALVDVGFYFAGVDFFSPMLVRMLRIFRVGRIIKLMKGLKSLLHCLRTLMLSLPALANVGMLLLLLIFIYACVGMQSFAGVMKGYRDDYAGVIDDNAFCEACSGKHRAHTCGRQAPRELKNSANAADVLTMLCMAS